MKSTPRASTGKVRSDSMSGVSMSGAVSMKVRAMSGDVSEQIEWRRSGLE